MIKTIIVEDEKVIREGLKKHVPWERLGIDEVYDASRAEDAIELCEKMKPDIIVSDIRMPGMDGIELCRKLREKYEKCKIIFVTGFSDKEYLKAAISLQAVSYVEKPVNIKEISSALENAVEQIKKSRAYEQAVVHSVFTKSDIFEYQWSGDTFFTAGILYTRNKNLKDDKREIGGFLEKILQDQGFHYYSERKDEKTEVFLVSDVHSGENRLRNIQVELEEFMAQQKEDLFIALGQEVDDQKDISRSYQSAEKARMCLGFKGWNTITYSGEHYCKITDSSSGKKDLNDFSVALTKNELNSALDIVKKITGRIENEHILVDINVRYWYYYMEEQVYHLTGVRKNNGDNEIEHLETVKELEEYICNLLLEEKSENKSSYIAKKVSDYIREHYSENDLSIKKIADVVYLTPTYLSNLYKKQTGITVGQYLTEVRMECAVQLLKDPKWKLYQIAAMVGFEDANYFAKIFKKKKGVTPSEYREKIV